MMSYLDRLFALPEPTASDPESAHVARLLQLLLKVSLVWLLVTLFIATPLFAVRKGASVVLALVGLANIFVCALLVRRGHVRASAWVYLAGGWVSTLICTVLSGGIRSPYMALFIVSPVIAGLLLGRRVGTLSLSSTGVVMLLFVISEYAGYPLPNYFPMPGAMSFGALALAVLLTLLVVHHTEAYSRQEALRLGEERLQLALQGANVAIFEWDVAEDRCLLSGRFYSALGFEQERAPATVQPALEAEMSACKREILLQAASGRDHLEHEVRLPDVSGEWVWFHVRATVTERDAQREASRVVGTLTDVTDQKRAQSELARARDLAKEAVQAKTAFLANMSHELRTPVSSIVGLSRILSDQQVPPEAQEIVKLIASSSEGLLEVINEILDLSRIEAGRIPVRRERTDLAPFCEHVMESLRHAAEQKGLGLVLESQPPPPEPVAIDPKLVRQVLINLLSNAIKFTDTGEVRLRLEWVPGLAAAGTVKLSVTDTGPGIAHDQQELIFEPFSQADSTSSRPHTGTGLGLAICRKLVHAFGGKIGIESAPGSGSKFWFTVPVELMPAYRRAVTPQQQPQRPPLYANVRVLVAEDNKVNRLVALRSLLALGIQADAAENGEQAIAAASSNAYDLILMDVQMPGVDGLQASRAIRICGRGNPFIAALTAHVLPEHRAECLAAGMNEFLSKPLEMEELREVLARISPSTASAQTA